MRPFLALALALVAACGSSTPAPAPSPLASRTKPGTPTTPPPHISWREGTADVRGFDVRQLPAIARDASIAVVPVVDSDGGRGYPNLHIEVRERGDFVARTIDVMTSNEYETLVTDEERPTPELDKRLAAANEQLAELHAAHDLVTMQQLTPSEPPKVDFDGHAVRVLARVRFGDYKTIAKVDATSWLPKPAPRCAQCPPCENPAHLDSVYKAPGIDAVVVRIAFSGTDTCWEPGAQLHVIAW